MAQVNQSVVYSILHRITVLEILEFSGLLSVTVEISFYTCTVDDVASIDFQIFTHAHSIH